MIKEMEDAGEKTGVGTWVDFLGGACFISLNSACGQFHMHAAICVSLLLDFILAPLAIQAGSRPHTAVSGTHGLGSLAYGSRRTASTGAYSVTSRRLLPTRFGRPTTFVALSGACRANSYSHLPLAFLPISLHGSHLFSTFTLILHLTGDIWNILEIGFQPKQVRERLAKGLVDKGVLRTEKRNFLLFDTAMHPMVRNLRSPPSAISH
ncbi:hypothetical protein B0H14DRAFT_3536914 [Mycena olivaceomarginata]|nr:hypothetical protein B0H14DRAFT_3536914 [Mycena olivaceomarginata]